MGNMRTVTAKIESCPRGCGVEVGRLQSFKHKTWYSVKIGKKLSDTQAECGVADFHNCDPAKVVAPVVPKFEGIAKLFRAVIAKKPSRLNVKVSDDNATIEVRYTAGRPVLYVTDGKPYGESRYFGAINVEDGSFRFGRNKPEAAESDLMKKFDTDPVATAVASARITGACSFCSRRLTDDRSIVVGYGPVCAESYGLPWGTQRQDAAPLYSEATA